MKKAYNIFLRHCKVARKKNGCQVFVSLVVKNAILLLKNN